MALGREGESKTRRHAGTVMAGCGLVLCSLSSAATPGPRDLGFTWKTTSLPLAIEAVRPSSAAAVGKFQRGDIIRRVEAAHIPDLRTFLKQLDAYGDGARVRIQVERDGRSRESWLTIPGRGGGPTGGTLPVQTLRFEYRQGKNLALLNGQPFSGLGETWVAGDTRIQVEYRDGEWLVERTWNLEGMKVQDRFFDRQADGGHERLQTIVEYHPNGRKKSEGTMEELSKGEFDQLLKEKGIAPGWKPKGDVQRWDEQGQLLPPPPPLQRSAGVTPQE